MQDRFQWSHFIRSDGSIDAQGVVRELELRLSRPDLLVLQRMSDLQFNYHHPSGNIHMRHPFPGVRDHVGRGPTTDKFTCEHAKEVDAALHLRQQFLLRENESTSAPTVGVAHGSTSSSSASASTAPTSEIPRFSPESILRSLDVQETELPKLATYLGALRRLDATEVDSESLRLMSNVADQLDAEAEALRANHFGKDIKMIALKPGEGIRGNLANRLLVINTWRRADALSDSLSTVPLGVGQQHEREKYPRYLWPFLVWPVKFKF
jgi:hypothetical protein